MNFIRSLLVVVLAIALTLFSPILIVVAVRLLFIMSAALLYPFNLIAKRLELDPVDEFESGFAIINGDNRDIHRRA